jgi:hypothetical protein
VEKWLGQPLGARCTLRDPLRHGAGKILTLLQKGKRKKEKEKEEKKDYNYRNVLS